jgi:nucleotide-binding universal stress UspA family protein
MNDIARTVVVGVDESDGSRAAVDLAAREATLRGLPLRLVHGYLPPPSTSAAPEVTRAG